MCGVCAHVIQYVLRFVVANDEFKFKEFNVDSKQCRKTTLAPRFGNPPVVLLPIPNGNANSAVGEASGSIPDHFCFATSSRVIGIGAFPLTGNPSSVSATIDSGNVMVL